MLFRPEDKEWTDPWVVHHQGSYWLYRVVVEGGVGAALELCRSADGVHWADHGRVLSRGEGARSLEGGGVWRAPTYERDGRFLLGFSERRGSIPIQVSPAIHMAESTDLIHWRRLGSEYAFRPDPRWYRAVGAEVRWHDVCTIPRGAGGRYGYWTADPISPEPGFGFGESLDCCHWRALPPPDIDWGGRPAPPTLRMAGVARTAKHMLAFVEGARTSRGQRCVYLLVSQRPGGPFALAPGNDQILATSAPGDAGLGLRLVENDGETLVSHVATTCHGERWLAPLKRLRTAPDGSAWLAYWPGNDVLHGERAEISLDEPPHGSGALRVTMLGQRLDVSAGVMLEGRWTGLPTQGSDLFLGGGLYVETEQGRGEGILVPMLGQALAGPVDETGADLGVEDVVDRGLPPRESARFRLLLRGELAEVYIEDVLMCSIGLPGPATGRIGLVAAGRTEARDVCAYRLTL
jgi:hypothetical protein